MADPEIVQIEEFFASKKKLVGRLEGDLKSIVGYMVELETASGFKAAILMHKIKAALIMFISGVKSEIERNKEFAKVFDHDRYLLEREEFDYKKHLGGKNPRASFQDYKQRFGKFTKKVQLESGEYKQLARTDRILIKGAKSLIKSVNSLEKGARGGLECGAEVEVWMRSDSKKIIIQLQDDLSILNRIVSGDYLEWEKLGNLRGDYTQQVATTFAQPGFKLNKTVYAP